MALARVQSTGRVFATFTTTIALTFATPPTLGNGLIVMIFGWAPGGLTFSPTGCTDNQGHTYLQAIARANASGTNAAAIYYLPLVATTGAPFTITVTLGGGFNYFEAAAVEVSGGGALGLQPDQVAGQTGSSGTVTTGTSPLVTAAEVFVAAAHAISANQAAITVEVLTPPWTQEFENLNHSATIAGEVDTRLRASAAGTGQTATWTASTAAPYTAVLAAFRAGVVVPLDTPARVTQLALEAFVAQVAAARATQIAVEVFHPILTPARTTQLLVEYFDARAAAVRASQVIVEVFRTEPPEQCPVDFPFGDDAALFCVTTPFPIAPDDD